jgi:hypothetical protein
MTESFIIYTPNPPSISTLTSSGKQSQWSNIQKGLEELLDNYKKNDFGHQELELFDFIEKPLDELSNKDFFKVIKKLTERIKDHIEENDLSPEPVMFNSSDRNIFNLTYKNIFSIVNDIIYIIDNITSKGKTYDIVHDFAYKGILPQFKDAIISKQQLSKLFMELDSIKIVNVCLYKENDDLFPNNKNENKKDMNENYEMDKKVVFYFCIFFSAIFKSIIGVTIDLNIKPIDDYFDNNNPYLINENNILNLGDNYKDFFICNLLLIKIVPNFSHLTTLKLKMFDSYQVELHSVLSDMFDDLKINDIDSFKLKGRSKTTHQRININLLRHNSNNLENRKYFYSPKFNNNYLFAQHIISSFKTNIYKLYLDFNSLDPLLFTSVNYLLANFKKIEILKLTLFPHTKINKRKTYINNHFYNHYSNNEDHYSNLYSTEDKEIYYPYIEEPENNSENNYLLKDEKILNELFYSFNINLLNLSIILEKQIVELLTLKIDFGTYNNKSISLYNYDNYNCAIVCFIFDLFKTLQTNISQSKINCLEILYEDFLDEKSFIVENIKRKIPSYKNGLKLNDLNISNINFNLSNISLFLPFENFPSVGLTELILSNLTFNDLNNLVSAFKKNKNIFPVLIKLDISLSIMVEDYNMPLETLLKECLSQELVYFNMTLPFNIPIYQLIDFLYWIKCNHNSDTNINIKIAHSQLSPCIKHYYFKNCVVDLFNSSKEYFRKRNLLPNFEISNEQTIKFIINKYDIKNLDYYYNFIYCFNKLNNIGKNMNNQKIFENIFNYRGGFKKYEVEIEVIN